MIHSDEMKPLFFVYNGFYYLYEDAGLTRKTDFSAWAACTLTSAFYAFAVLLVIGKFYDDRFGEGSFPFLILGLIFGASLAWLSDWNIQHTWFGAHRIDMSGRTRTRAKLVSFCLLIGSWLSFIGIGVAIYY